jgi:hypothetical protein
MVTHLLDCSKHSLRIYISNHPGVHLKYRQKKFSTALKHGSVNKTTRRKGKQFNDSAWNKPKNVRRNAPKARVVKCTLISLEYCRDWKFSVWLTFQVTELPKFIKHTLNYWLSLPVSIFIIIPIPRILKFDN